jgi:hypothetical protein
MNDEEVSSTDMDVSASEFLQTMWAMLENKEAMTGYHMGELAVRVTFDNADGTTNRMILSRYVPEDYEDSPARFH